MSLLSDRDASRAIAGVLAVIAGTLAMGGYFMFGRRGDPDACEPLARRYAELHLRAVEDRPLPATIQSAEEGLVSRATDVGALRECRSRLTRTAQICAERAPSVDDFERCFP